MNNNTKRRKRRRSINGRILIGLIIAAFFMYVGTSGFMMLRDTFEVFNIQNSTSFSYSNIAAAAIDGEDPKWYTTIGEDDESYQWVLNFLDSVS